MVHLLSLASLAVLSKQLLARLDGVVCDTLGARKSNEVLLLLLVLDVGGTTDNENVTEARVCVDGRAGMLVCKFSSSIGPVAPAVEFDPHKPL